MKRLEGKIALITGAAAGIGRATAELFMNEGAKVIATDINEKELSSLKGASLEVLDVTNSSEIKALANKLGAIDVLFNCAGYVHQGDILSCSEKDFDFSMNLNVKSMYKMIYHFIPFMLEAKKGASIINMSSVASNVIAAKNRFAYGTSKAAVIGLSKAIAADYIQDKIRCNAIAPGTVQSPSLEVRMKDSGDYDKARQDFIDRQPLGRIGTTKEIASLVLYLASDESSYTTGTTHIIDGGWSNT